MKNKIDITRTARNPGISLTLCSQPISTPEKPDTSMTKLFSKATHVENAMGMAMASKTSKPKGSFEKIVFFNICEILSINGIGNEQ